MPSEKNSLPRQPERASWLLELGNYISCPLPAPVDPPLALHGESALPKLPMTVVFRYSKPSVWYARDVEGTVVRRSIGAASKQSKDLAPKAILQAFVDDFHSANMQWPGAASDSTAP